MTSYVGTSVPGKKGEDGTTFLVDAAKANDSVTVGTTRTVMHSVDFVAPASGIVKISAHTASALSTFATLLIFVGIAAPVSQYKHAHIAGLSTANPGSGALVARFSGLTAGVTYSAVIEWQATAGTGTCNAATDPNKYSAYILVEAMSA